MTLRVDTSPPRTTGVHVKDDSLKVSAFPMIGARVEPVLNERLAIAAQKRGLSKGEYAARLLAAAQDALDAQEAPLQSTG